MKLSPFLLLTLVSVVFLLLVFGAAETGAKDKERKKIRDSTKQVKDCVPNDGPCYAPRDECCDPKYECKLNEFRDSKCFPKNSTCHKEGEVCTNGAYTDCCDHLECRHSQCVPVATGCKNTGDCRRNDECCSGLCVSTAGNEELCVPKCT